MTLKEKSEEITQALNSKMDELIKYRQKLVIERNEAYEEYRAANTGDRSENAPLDAAIKHMKDVNADTLSNEQRIKQLSVIDDLSNYNSVGMVLLYSTIHLVDEDNNEFIYKIYPKDVSFPEIGVIAENSRIAIAAMGKSAGDIISVEHSSRGVMVNYTIKEIY